MESEATSFRSLIANQRLLLLYDYWLARRGSNRAMQRGDFDPLDTPQLLGCLILSDVGDGGDSIQYRLVGTEIVDAHGFDYTGKTIEELTSGETLAYTRQLYRRIIGGPVPVYSEGYFRWAGKEHRWTKRLHLPLLRDGSAVDMVLAGQVFEKQRKEGKELMFAATEAQVAQDLKARANPENARP